MWERFRFRKIGAAKEGVAGVNKKDGKETEKTEDKGKFLFEQREKITEGIRKLAGAKFMETLRIGARTYRDYENLARSQAGATEHKGLERGTDKAVIEQLTKLYGSPESIPDKELHEAQILFDEEMRRLFGPELTQTDPTTYFYNPVIVKKKPNQE